MVPRVVVVGGGVAGLACARALAGSHEVVLLESEQHLGGKLQTGSLLGRPLDLGPDAFITRDPSALRLCRELGLEDELVAPATSGASVFARGRLRPLPVGLVLGIPTDLKALWRSGIVAPTSVLRAALDLLLPGTAIAADPRASAEAGGPDPTVADVAGRRLGREVLDNLVDPLIGGINAGDSRALSFLAAAPGLAERAAGRHSLLRALRPPSGASVPDPPEAATLVTSGPPKTSSLFLGLTGGMGRLVEALTRACEAAAVEIRRGAPGRAVAPEGSEGLWRVWVGDAVLEADAVVLAAPAYAAAQLLSRAAPDLASECAAISYASVVTATFAWPADAVPRAVADALADLARTANPDAPAGRLPGSGVLVPRAGGRLITAASFTSTKWPHSARDGEVVVRASAGRHGDDRAIELGDGELSEALRGELAELLGVRSTPRAEIVQRWPRSFPQYLSGHRARVARIDRLAGQLPAFALAGAAYRGIGIPACIASGEQAAEHVRRVLAGAVTPR
ncbi:MAG: UDP-galactopyranose mutase [Acidimicrobiaceae bacterium]|nr:UDP-galactopyranose mutase [Acidimicrobiaceae bacterium]